MAVFSVHLALPSLFSCRLRLCTCPQGLDGEATEPMVSSLPDPQAIETDPEDEYQVAAVLASRPQQQQSGGHLAMLTQRLESVAGGKQGGSSRDAGSKEASQLVRLLHHAAQLEVRRCTGQLCKITHALLCRAIQNWPSRL